MAVSDVLGLSQNPWPGEEGILKNAVIRKAQVHIKKRPKHDLNFLDNRIKKIHIFTY
jgi:hypothetical protein